MVMKSVIRQVKVIKTVISNTSVTEIKAKVKAEYSPRRELALEVQGVTCHMISQCYLPPDTSERAPH